ncbi:GntR family transcriptional regulator [Rhizobium sp. 1AS11]|uniref:GntR family transcriptional regulator n=1 Tax=Rhizobium acaciae TaxID=2989736 RepID=UPI002222C2CF|nr:GntR family transcriptional regulator [Rhizobium acaciae]MCW1413809.1 GntR family transcriptional regulator [Rhizobium acaciae]MCW1745946.1 GntR family transcriptional regulator [Rhizobium acaciae]
MSDAQIGTAVLNTLRDMILRHELRPGEKLVDRTLAAQLQASRTPVREAFGRLEVLGLVEKRDRGYFVVEMSSSRAFDLYQLREVLEVAAVSLAAEKATKSDLQEFREIVEQVNHFRTLPGRRADEVRVGMILHESIARVSGNKELHQALVRVLNQMVTFMWMEVLHEPQGASAGSQDEHERIVKYIEMKDGPNAAEIMRSHIRAGRERLTAVLRAREAQSTFVLPAGYGLSGLSKQQQ